MVLHILLLLFSVTVTEESIHWPAVKDEDSGPIVAIHPPKENRPADTVIVDDFDRPDSKYFENKVSFW